ncbi:MAG: hypothetical protein P4L33_20925 [Capsulimonadaceae bacterium]|nr:hypothetical protein [Capsulimonadaceae bacterium]
MTITKDGIVRDPAHTGWVPTWDKSGVGGYQPNPGGPELGRTIVREDPLLKNMPNDYDDPYLSPSTSPDAKPAKDPLEALKNPLTDKNRPENWYWLHGHVQYGEVAVRVNGRPIGKFGVRADIEITDFLHTGSNTVEFRPIPAGASRPVEAHLELVFSQQSRGEEPVLIYDTSRINADRAMIRNTHAPKIGGVGFAADPNESSMLNTVPDLGPRTETMTFMAE